MDTLKRIKEHIKVLYDFERSPLRKRRCFLLEKSTHRFMRFMEIDGD
jgi:hypothetical protein